MRVETIELLRCPVAHEPSPLVTVAFERDGDWLIEGLLGCSVCGAEFALVDGVVHLGAPAALSASISNADMTLVASGEVSPSDASDHALRVAAMLGLSEPGMRVLLCGDFGDCASALARTTGARCLVVNATGDGLNDRDTDRLTMSGDASLPLANGALHGIAVDARHAALLAQAATVVRVGGRVVANVDAPVPTGCRELARDAQQWVAEVEAVVSGLVSLRARVG